MSTSVQEAQRDVIRDQPRKNFDQESGKTSGTTPTAQNPGTPDMKADQERAQQLSGDNNYPSGEEPDAHGEFCQIATGGSGEKSQTFGAQRPDMTQMSDLLSGSRIGDNDSKRNTEQEQQQEDAQQQPRRDERSDMASVGAYGAPPSKERELRQEEGKKQREAQLQHAGDASDMASLRRDAMGRGPEEKKRAAAEQDDMNSRGQRTGLQATEAKQMFSEASSGGDARMKPENIRGEGMPQIGNSATHAAGGSLGEHSGMRGGFEDKAPMVHGASDRDDSLPQERGPERGLGGKGIIGGQDDAGVRGEERGQAASQDRPDMDVDARNAYTKAENVHGEGMPRIGESATHAAGGSLGGHSGMRGGVEDKTTNVHNQPGDSLSTGALRGSHQVGGQDDMGPRGESKGRASDRAEAMDIDLPMGNAPQDGRGPSDQGGSGMMPAESTAPMDIGQTVIGGVGSVPGKM